MASISVGALVAVFVGGAVGVLLASSSTVTVGAAVGRAGALVARVPSGTSGFASGSEMLPGPMAGLVGCGGIGVVVGSVPVAVGVLVGVGVRDGVKLALAVGVSHGVGL